MYKNYKYTVYNNEKLFISLNLIHTWLIKLTSKYETSK